jgi:phage-related protein
VADHGGSTYRVVYTTAFPGVVYALHAFQKKSKKGSKTPKHEVELIKQRLRAAKERHEKRHDAVEETEAEE